jgi:hypothetical protein
MSQSDPTHTQAMPTESLLWARQIGPGGALLSPHRAGKGLELIVRQPTVGGADICLRWSGPVESAADLLRTHEPTIVDGPSRRRTADGRPAFRSISGIRTAILLEFMASDGSAGG